MEPYDLKVQQLTFNEDQIQDGSLDSFSNVVHYDSALIDHHTGKKPSTNQISNSNQFAWSSSTNHRPLRASHDQLQSPLTSEIAHPNKAPNPLGRFLPTPFQSTCAASAKCDTSLASTTKGEEYALEINKLIKDVYSEIAVPFAPLVQRTTIPDWIYLQDNNTFGRAPQHFIAQPSKVKVTHVYNQVVWSQGVVPSSPGSKPTSITTFDLSQHSFPSSTVGHTLNKPIFQGVNEISTLKQVVTNTTAVKSYQSGGQIYRMASSNGKPVPSTGQPVGDSRPQFEMRSGEPFESVAEALHLQQSVIGHRPGLTPVSADVVAQIVKEAERKINMGLTPPINVNAKPETVQSGADVQKPFSFPPLPHIPDLALSKELLRKHGLGVGLTVQPGASHNYADISNQSTASSETLRLSSPENRHLSGLVTVSDILPDDNQSVASSNSELENFNDNATDSFLQSLPPFRHVNLMDILPESTNRTGMRHSPPVKESSFRPVQFTRELTPKASEMKGEAYAFVNDSGVYSTLNSSPVSASSATGTKSLFVIPKPGPLFHSTPRRDFQNDQLSKSLQTQPSIQSSSSDKNGLLEDVKREKAKLEGQLEMLNMEAQATLQERAELQAQVASLKLKLMGQKTHRHDTEKDMLKADLESLKQLRISLEGSLNDLQRQLEEKSEEGRSLQEELSQSQDQMDKLNLKMKEMRDDVKTKEMTIQALKNKIAELYVEVQSSIHVKMEADSETRAAKSELLSLQSSKEWYQQQLELATRARSELQKDLTLLQAQASSQSSIIERLKTENTRLRQQFTDIQNRALKEKEILAKHLEAIESDMMDREAAFQEIQRERSFLEDAFSNKIQTAEDEKNRISLLMQMTNDLENQLEKAHVDLKKKQNQIVQLENENIELMKKLNISQETVSEKENVVEELKHDLIKLEDKLKAFQKSIVNKDTELLKHKEEKAKIEIALNAALQEKESVDKSLDNLKSDMGKVEKSFKMMRQELNSKSAEVHTAKSSSKATLDHIETLKTDLENERRKYELAKSEFGNKNELLQDLQGQKINLESEVTILREKIVAMEASHDEIAKDKQILDSELNATREKLEELKMKFEAEAKTEKGKMQLSSNDNEEYAKMQEQQESLREKLAASEKDSKKDLLKHRARVAKLNQDLNAVKTELMERQKTFDDNIEVLSEKLREMALEKDKLETELTMTHRKYEFSMLEQKDQIGTELQNLASELQQVRLEKQELKSQYMALQHARDQDLHQYQQQLEAMGEELRLSREMEVESTITVEANQALQLELEKEKGRLAGLMQSNATLKHHVSQLEEALASRESTLVEMQTAWGEQARTHERSVHENLRRVQVLEESLKMEKDGQRDLRKQIGIKITENKKLKRQNDGLKQDVETLRQDLAQRVQEVGILQGELETSKQSVLSHQSEMAAIEAESKSIQRELERVQQQLRDSVSREPVILEQIKGLEWKLELKSRELTAVQEQLAVSEERQLAEMGAVRHLLQEKTGEIENLKMESSALKHDKQSQQAKLSELRSALKSSIHYHKLTKKFVHLTGHVGEGDSPGVELPPLPFDLEDMDRLLQETTVRALESKPLDNLQNCLLNLRSEISGLQSQMEVHSTTIQSSNHSWSSIEQQVQELCTVVQTLTQTSAATATTDSLAAAAVDMANGIINI